MIAIAPRRIGDRRTPVDSARIVPQAYNVDARNLPVGTVTFLFTDIEGSTRLLQQLGDHYAGALSVHRELLRRAFQGNGGVEMGTEGDALFYAFSRATDAVAAALDGQTALEGGKVRVRMGLHTGEPRLTDEGYVGVDLHLSARICSAAHGRQVLLSSTTMALVDTPHRDLGEHLLKDFDTPQRLYQMGLEDFPPLRTLSLHNLPLSPVPIVGRARERADVSQLLQVCRLVSLIGPGGTGKTRLALQIAADASSEYEHGVCWVSLASIREPELVEAAIAAALGVRDSIAAHLSERQLLLVLDNFEQVVEAAPLLTTLLGLAARVTILVTSREALRLAAEHEYPVPPLPQADAIALFTVRARSIASDFTPDDGVAEICRRLDGLPLALELAAARIRTMSAAQILDRLGQRLLLLTAGARDLPERQRTLRATIDWSYELLSQDEQVLFARLSIFSGGCTLDASEDICDASLDVLDSLAAKSLVVRSSDRVVMLESIREYASERLEASGELTDLRTRHSQYFLRLSEEGAPEVDRDDAEAWIRRLNDEHANIRDALEDFRRTEESELELRLVAAVWRFWFDQGRWQEATHAVQRALDARSDTTKASVIVLQGAAWTSWRQGDEDAGVAYAEEALRQSRTIGDPSLTSRSLRILGACLKDSELAKAITAVEESAALAETVGDLSGLSASLNNLAIIATSSGDYQRASELFERSLSASRASGSERGSSICLMNLAESERNLGDYSSARRHLGESFDLAQKLGIREVVVESLYGLAAVATSQGDHMRAATLIGAAQREGEEFGHVLEDYDQKVYVQTMTRLKQQLGEDVLERAILAGRALSPSAAIAFDAPLG
jgi:predicted ATPase/class 3 adenylate cyclase